MTQDTPAQQPSGQLTIALVEDEPDLREGLQTAFEREGLAVQPLADGDAAWAQFAQQLPDIAVLDIMLPGVDGLELCRRLRTQSETLPILFLTSRDEEFDRVLGLELGADDYLCKPFSLRELIARVRVLIRRLRLQQDRSRAGEDCGTPDHSIANAAPADDDSANPSVMERGPLCMDELRFQASWRERDLRLTITEFRLLSSLARNPGHVRTRTQLLQDAYPEDRYKSDRTIDTHIKRLRRKIEVAEHQSTSGRRPSLESSDVVETVYGVGYRFTERWPG